VTAKTFDPDSLLAALAARSVSFVVIGGWAAGAHGVGWTTFDLDIVVDGDVSAVSRLLQALEDVHAVFDTSHVPPIPPDIERLRSATGAMLFRTRHGRLDVLKEAGGETFASLCADAETVEVVGHRVMVASLAAIARMKRAANRRKDREVLPAIEAALEKRRRR
jgi:hypothetical protein